MCLTSIGLLLAASTSTAQDNKLRIAFPIQGSAGKVSDAQVPNRNSEMRLRNPSESLTDESASKDKRQDGLDKKAVDDEDSLGLSQRDMPPVKPAQETNREPIVLPTLAVPNTSIKSSSNAAMPVDMVSGRLPPSIPLPFGNDRFGIWSPLQKNWVPPVFCHQPTYFHDTMLEEHGHERCVLQPLVSGARFYSQVAFLPYLSYLDPPLQDSYRAGNFRPGSSAPCLRQRAPYDPGALRFQLLTTGTTVLAIQP